MSQHDREPLPPSWFEKNVDTIVRGVIGICVLLLVGDVVFHFVGHKHTHFAAEGWIGFYAVVGFVSYVGLVLTAKQLRKLLMRPLDYYGEEVPVGSPHPSSSRAGSSSGVAQGLAQSHGATEDTEEERGEESESDLGVRTSESEVGSRESEVGSRESEVGSRESESESESEPESESEWESDLGSRESDLGSRESDLGSRESESEDADADDDEEDDR